MKQFIRNEFTRRLIALRIFVSTELPTLNERIMRKEYCTMRFASQCGSHVEEVLNTKGSLIYTGNFAWNTMQPISYIVSSIERHFQTFHIPQKAFDVLPAGTEDLMIECGRILSIPPRDNIYTTWLKNRRFKFDNNKGWSTFKSGVLIFERCCREANKRLRLILDGTVQLSHVGAIQLLNEVYMFIEEIFQNWKTFMQKDQNGEYANISPTYFMYVFRTFFLEYQVGGENWSGTNAANIASGMSFDYLLGCIDDFYDDVVIERLRYVSPEDRKSLLKDMNSSSLVSLFTEELEITNELLKTASTYQLLQTVHATTVDSLRPAFNAFQRVVKKWSSLSLLHKGMISTFLEKPAHHLKDQGCPLGFDVPVVSPEAGTGGMRHNDTHAIMEMRTKNKCIESLNYIFNHAPEIVENNLILK